MAIVHARGLAALLSPKHPNVSRHKIPSRTEPEFFQGSFLSFPLDRAAGSHQNPATPATHWPENVWMGGGKCWMGQGLCKPPGAEPPKTLRFRGRKTPGKGEAPKATPTAKVQRRTFCVGEKKLIPHQANQAHMCFLSSSVVCLHEV